MTEQTRNHRHASTRWAAVFSIAAMLVVLSLSGCAKKAAVLPAVDGALLDAAHTRVYGVMQNGARVAESRFTAVQTAGGAGWTFNNKSIVNGATVQDTTVSTDNGFTPTHTVSDLTTPNGVYHIDATYQGTKVAITANTPNGPQSISRDAKAPFVDNDEILTVVGGMALKEGFTASFNVVVPNSGAMVSASVTVTGTEQVKVAFGEFSAYKVTLKFDTVSQTAWYAVDGHRMLKYDNGATVMELEQVNPIGG